MRNCGTIAAQIPLKPWTLDRMGEFRRRGTRSRAALISRTCTRGRRILSPLPTPVLGRGCVKTLNPACHTTNSLISIFLDGQRGRLEVAAATSIIKRQRFHTASVESGRPAWQRQSGYLAVVPPDRLGSYRDPAASARRVDSLAREIDQRVAVLALELLVSLRPFKATAADMPGRSWSKPG